MAEVTEQTETDRADLWKCKKDITYKFVVIEKLDLKSS